MTTLSEHQDSMLSLLKNRMLPPGANDPYLQSLGGSSELARLREVALWWCAFTVRTGCQWTCRLLERLQLFDETIETFFASENISPYAETATRQFLQRLTQHGDRVVAALAQFELVANERCIQNMVIDWDRDPNQVLFALRTGSPLPPRDSFWLYRVRLAPEPSSPVDVEMIEIDA